MSTELKQLFEQRLIDACKEMHSEIGCYQLHGRVFQRKLGQIAAELGVMEVQIDEIIAVIAVRSQTLSFTRLRKTEHINSVTMKPSEDSK